MVEGLETVLLAIYVVIATVGSLAVLYRLGDRIVTRTAGTNNDAQAVAMYVDLIHNAKRKLWIRDDGSESENTVYSNDEVLQAFEKQLEKHPRLEVRCLFNDKHAKLGLLDLVAKNPRVELRYTQDERTPDQLHYKIVDDGKILHLSTHLYGASERGYVVRKPPPWALSTRRRISVTYREEFEELWDDAEARS